VSIVDDDRSVRTATQTLIRSMGFKAAAFESAEDFLNSPEVETTDCLIADIQMPGMSGVDLQDALVARNSKLPIIFITAFPDDRIRERVLAAGAVCMLTKPCDGGKIEKYLEEALSRRN
jgi:FixJ family two-component response regulator